MIWELVVLMACGFPGEMGFARPDCASLPADRSRSAEVCKEFSIFDITFSGCRLSYPLLTEENRANYYRKSLTSKQQPNAELTADYADGADFLFFIRVIRVIRGKTFTKINDFELCTAKSAAPNAYVITRSAPVPGAAMAESGYCLG